MGKLTILWPLMAMSNYQRVICSRAPWSWLIPVDVHELTIPSENCNLTYGKVPFMVSCSIQKWWFSIAVLNYQRVFTQISMANGSLKFTVGKSHMTGTTKGLWKIVSCEEVDGIVFKIFIDSSSTKDMSHDMSRYMYIWISIYKQTVLDSSDIPKWSFHANLPSTFWRPLAVFRWGHCVQDRCGWGWAHGWDLPGGAESSSWVADPPAKPWSSKPWVIRMVYRW